MARQYGCQILNREIYLTWLSWVCAQLVKASHRATHPRRQVTAKRSMFAGMDVYKESIDVSRAEEGRDGEVWRYGVITGDLEAVAKVARTLRAPNRRLRFVAVTNSEAGRGLRI